MKQILNVIKVGGKIVEDAESLEKLIANFSKIGGNKILVHGGGSTATKIATQLGIESKMINGRRVTDEQTLKVVTMVYAGLVNKNIVAALQSNGVDAIGLCGADMNIVQCHKRSVGEIDYGFAGDIDVVNCSKLSFLLERGIVPVICPITHDCKGQLLNTNADTIASSIAASLASVFEVTLTYCFEKKGVLSNPSDDESVIHTITQKDYEKLKAQGIISGGMIPKLDNAFSAIESGVHRVIITNANSIGDNYGTVIL